MRSWTFAGATLDASGEFLDASGEKLDAWPRQRERNSLISLVFSDLSPGVNLLEGIKTLL